MRYALETTRATAVCPFHLDVTVRLGDYNAESHASLAPARETLSRMMAQNGKQLSEKRKLSEKSLNASSGKPQTVTVLCVRMTN